MRKFKYEFSDAAGNISTGVVDAMSEAEAADIVRTQGEVMSIAPAAAGAGNFMNALRKIRIDMPPTRKDVLVFTNQLSVMVKAGINLRDALRGIADRLPESKFRQVIQKVRADVEGGQPFSTALAAHPKVFSPLHIHMVHAAEISGTMGQMLDRVAEYLNQQMETRSMLIGAMVYPAIIFFMSIGATIFLLAFALPKFTTIFAGKEALLPKPTVILLGMSYYLRHYWQFMIAGVAGLAVGFRFFAHSSWGRAKWDVAKLHIPVIQPMLHALYISQGLRALGELITAGAPVLDALSITSDITASVPYKRMWNDVQSQVKDGTKIAKALGHHTLMPPDVVQMVAAGEESGSLAEVLGHVSGFYARELKAKIKTVCSVIEPLMIVIMGVVVGFIAMSIILPIFKMSSLVK